MSRPIAIEVEASPAASACPSVKLAAVLYHPSQGDDIDRLLEQVARELKSRSYRLAGTVQCNAPGQAGPCSDMVLEDLMTGRRVLVSEERGPLAKGCRLDSGALEAVAGLVRASIGPGIDVVIVNKFSKSEAEGAGLRQVIEAAVVAGLPVVVGINASSRVAWDDFAGAETQWLPHEADAIIAWCEAALA